MSSLLPHDLCRGRSASLWPPTLFFTVVLLYTPTYPAAATVGSLPSTHQHINLQHNTTFNTLQHTNTPIFNTTFNTRTHQPSTQHNLQHTNTPTSIQHNLQHTNTPSTQHNLQQPSTHQHTNLQHNLQQPNTPAFNTTQPATFNTPTYQPSTQPSITINTTFSCLQHTNTVLPRGSSQPFPLLQ